MIALALVGCALVLAVWDVGRRALASQVRTAELRVEALRRVEYEAAQAEIAKLRDEVQRVARDVSALDTALAVGRRR